MKQLIKNDISQIWTNVKHMTKRERKAFIKYVIGLNTTNCSHIEYASKSLFIHIIAHTECYFNNSGRTTPVKEFLEAGIKH